MNRQEIISSEIENDPNNPFNYYLLAIEFRQLNSFQDLENVMELMLERFEYYLPLYYFYAEHLFQMDKIEKATQISERGIRLAQESGNSKLVNELKQLILINT